MAPAASPSKAPTNTDNGERFSIPYIKEVVAPGNHGAHGAVPRVSRARLTSEEVERFVQAHDELFQRQRRDTGRGQLECERKALHLANDRSHGGVVERRRCVHRSGAGPEQFGARSIVQSAQLDDVLARRPQRLAGGRQDPQVGTACQ